VIIPDHSVVPFNINNLSTMSTTSTDADAQSIPIPNPIPVPILLLKTRSQPHDAYEEYFPSSPITGPGSAYTFKPRFVPVLEHRPNSKNLSTLEDSLRDGSIKDKYGGMIFTSQRAVEAWTAVVKRVEGSQAEDVRRDVAAGGMVRPPQVPSAQRVGVS
jgi:uroporphyrinogen-III synthase